MEALTQINRKSLRARTKLDTTMCPEGMSGGIRSVSGNDLSKSTLVVNGVVKRSPEKAAGIEMDQWCSDGWVKVTRQQAEEFAKERVW